MALLPDHMIRKYCLNATWHKGHPMIEPFSEGVSEGGVISYGLTSAGYDLRLGNELLMLKNTWNEPLDPKQFQSPEYMAKVFDKIKPWPNNRYTMPPHSYALAVSLEHIHIPRGLKGRVVGKSTFARCGLLVNCTPLEPNWKGYLTIELSNISPCPAVLHAEEGIAQLEFEQLSSEPEIDYEQKKGKYQAQKALPTPARVKE